MVGADGKKHGDGSDGGTGAA